MHTGKMHLIRIVSVTFLVTVIADFLRFGVQFSLDKKNVIRLPIKGMALYWGINEVFHLCVRKPQ